MIIVASGVPVASARSAPPPPPLKKTGATSSNDMVKSFKTLITPLLAAPTASE